MPSDNVKTIPGTGSDPDIATDEIAGAHYQRIKLIKGDDGVNDGDISDANPLPVTGAITVAGGSITVDGAVNATIVNPDLVVTGSYTVGTLADGGDAIFNVGFVRDDTLSTVGAADGEWTEGRVDSLGALWTHDKDTVPVNMDYTFGTSTDIYPAVGMAFRGNTGVQFVATNNGLPINATGTSIAILDGSGNNYLSASATLNQASGAGLFPAVTVAQYDDVSPTAVTENRFGNLRMSSTRELYVAIQKAASGGAANVSSSASSVTLIAANINRKGFTIFNDSAQILYVKFGATASTSSFHVKMAAGGYYESMVGVNYTGIIDGIWASADGSARIGEFT